MAKLSQQQRSVLAKLRLADGPVSGPMLAAAVGTSVAGAHQTARSLVVHHLAVRIRGGGLVYYVITEAGRREVGL